MSNDCVWYRILEAELHLVGQECHLVSPGLPEAGNAQAHLNKKKEEQRKEKEKKMRQKKTNRKEKRYKS